MKKFYLLITSTLLLSSVFSQAPLRTYKASSTRSMHRVMPMNRVVTKLSSDYTSKASTYATRSTSISENINAIDYVTNFLGTTPYLAYTNPIFPDSNIMIGWSGGASAPWLHAISQTFDLGTTGYLASTGGQFDTLVQPFDPNGSTTVDSITIQGYYERPDNSVTDTAIVSIVLKGHGNYTLRYNGGAPDSTIYVVSDKDSNNIPDSTVWLGKIVLDSAFKADTLSNGGHMFVVAPGVTFSNYDGVIGVTISFVSGKASYSQATDTIFKNMNWINFVYATPQGASTAFPLGQTGGRETTAGGLFTGQAKYTPFSVGGFHFPAIVYTGSHPYQLFDMTLKVTQENCLGSALGDTSNVNSCGDYTSASGKVWTMSNTYLDTLTSSRGCDSVATIVLTVTNIDKTTALAGAVITANQTGAAYKWLDCNNSYAPISGATGMSYTATFNGDFAVEITVGSCVDTSSCTNINTFGLNENNKDYFSLNVFPNPTAGKLTIDNQNQIIKEIKVWNVYGKLMNITTGNDNTIDVSSLKTGVYIIKITTEKGISHSRFVKK